MAPLATYAFKNVVTLIDSVPASGWADGDSVITIERSVDAFSLLVGADGDAMGLGNADRSGIATMQFLQTSRTNALLTAKLKLQDAGIFVPFPFIVRDPAGDDLTIAESALIVGPPQAVYGAGHNAREWRLALAAVDIYLNGAA